MIIVRGGMIVDRRRNERKVVTEVGSSVWLDILRITENNNETFLPVEGAQRRHDELLRTSEVAKYSLVGIRNYTNTNVYLKGALFFEYATLALRIQNFRIPHFNTHCFSTFFDLPSGSVISRYLMLR